MFYITLTLAMLVSISTTLFCVASGAGGVLDLLGASSVILLLIGSVASVSDLKQGSILSTLGVGACGIAVLIDIAELVHAIPFSQQPGQISLLYVPFLFLVILGFHLASIRARLKRHQDDELMKALGGKTIR